MKMKNNLSIFFFITYNIKFRPTPVVWGTKYTKLLIGREGSNEKLMHGLLTKMRNSSSSKGAKNVPDYKRGNHNWTIQRNWQHRVHKTKINKAKTQRNRCWTTGYTQTNINNVNKTRALPQITRSKDESIIVLYAEIVTVIKARNSRRNDT